MKTVKVVDMHVACIGVSRDFEMKEMFYKAGPPPSLNGMTIGLAEMSVPPPHNGERHSDGDELIIVVSGRIRVLLDGGSKEGLELGEGQAFVVPQGVWHRVEPMEPTRLIFITPGPNNEHR